MAKLDSGWIPWVAVVASVALGCGGKTAKTTAPIPESQQVRPLGGLIGQQMLIAPAQRARVAAELGWSGVPKPADLTTALDSNVALALRARDIARNWTFGDVLVQSYARNPTYATDPHNLSVDPLRSGKVEVGARLPEPLATQLRTMIALTQARLVLLPVEIRVERVEASGAGMGRAVVRLVLIDPRSSDIKWTSEINGDVVPAYGPGLFMSVATKLANLFIAP